MCPHARGRRIEACQRESTRTGFASRKGEHHDSFRVWRRARRSSLAACRRGPDRWRWRFRRIGDHAAGRGPGLDTGP